MRILLLSSFFPPAHSAGTENYTYEVARALLRSGHKVRVLCAGRWDDGIRYWNGYSDEIYNGLPVRRLRLNWKKALDPNRSLYENPLVASFLGKYLKEVRPDVVHITSCLTLSASIIRTLRQAGIPAVVTLTDFWFLCPRINLLRSDGELCDGRTTATECVRCMARESKIYRIPNQVLPQSIVDNLLTVVGRHQCLSRLRGLRGIVMNMMHRKTYLRETLMLGDCVIAPSEFLKHVFLLNEPSLQIRVLPHGHDLSWLESYSGKKPSAGIRFGYLGQVIPIKGVHLLIHAFRAMPGNENAVLSIFGDLGKDPPYTQRLRQMATGHSNIVFKGAFAHEHLSEVLAEIDVVVVPSLWYENNPLVIQEAFAARTPIIATNLGGMSEFVLHEINGLLFERGDVEDLTRQLQRVIVEPELLKRLEAGIPRVKRIEEEVEELEGIYHQLAGRTQRPELVPTEDNWL